MGDGTVMVVLVVHSEMTQWVGFLDASLIESLQAAFWYHESFSSGGRHSDQFQLRGVYAVSEVHVFSSEDLLSTVAMTNI